MTKFFNAFLLNLILLSGRYQFDAVLLDPSTLDKDNFEIEDSEFNEIENLPASLRSNPDPTEYRKVRENTRQGYYHKRGNEPLVGFFSRNVNNQPFEGNILEGTSLHGLDDCCSAGRLHSKEFSDWQYGPLDVSSINAKMKKWNVAENPRIKRNSERFLSTLAAEKPARYLDYTNSQMPFNEGKLRRKEFSTSKSPEVAGKSVRNEKSNFDLEEYPEMEGKPKRSMRRRRFFEVPRKSRYIEIPRDDPLLEYSRVRRFLDHKRAKKQIRMTSTLEAKEAAMSRVLDPNLNSDGILEPHVRKRRGLRTKKRDLSFTPRHKHPRLKRQKTAYDSMFNQNRFEY